MKQESSIENVKIYLLLNLVTSVSHDQCFIFVSKGKEKQKEPTKAQESNNKKIEKAITIFCTTSFFSVFDFILRDHFRIVIAIWQFYGFINVQTSFL